VASGRNDEPRGEFRWNWHNLAGALRRQAANSVAWRLLPGQGEGEFAVADAHGEALGETRRRLLAVGRDEFGKSGEQASLRQAIPVDAVDARFGPGRVEVAERSPFLLMIRSLPGTSIACAVMPMWMRGLVTRGKLARDAHPPRRNWRNG